MIKAPELNSRVSENGFKTYYSTSSFIQVFGPVGDISLTNFMAKCARRRQNRRQPTAIS
jgi:hypothetical protein